MQAKIIFPAVPEGQSDEVRLFAAESLNGVEVGGAAGGQRDSYERWQDE